MGIYHKKQGNSLNKPFHHSYKVALSKDYTFLHTFFFASLIILINKF